MNIVPVCWESWQSLLLWWGLEAVPRSHLWFQSVKSQLNPVFLSHILPLEFFLLNVWGCSPSMNWNRSFQDLRQMKQMSFGLLKVWVFTISLSFFLNHIISYHLLILNFLTVFEECLRFDHGYSSSSRVIKDLFQVLCSLSPSQRTTFLTFVTGSPRLPVQGKKTLWY